MKASEFLKRYERQMKEKEGQDVDHSLEAQARKRAQHPEHLNAGTPHDWEELEKYQNELDRMEKHKKRD
ncbi:peptidase S14 [Marinimicrobium alkaliphilum]|uniref:peptidase S14 n=1 Tax=Marinimicrobium alkaliphilum TaxID=2202654 RepID=UPI000DBAD211|nr:peptidase S14 [Marinimicrobium alkaliphilum]